MVALEGVYHHNHVFFNLHPDLLDYLFMNDDDHLSHNMDTFSDNEATISVDERKFTNNNVTSSHDGPKALAILDNCTFVTNHN